MIKKLIRQEDRIFKVYALTTEYTWEEHIWRENL